MDDSELKRTFSQARPYEEWLDRQLMTLDDVVQSVPEEERQAEPIIGTLAVRAPSSRNFCLLFHNFQRVFPSHASLSVYLCLCSGRLAKYF